MVPQFISYNLTKDYNTVGEDNLLLSPPRLKIHVGTMDSKYSFAV